MTTDDIYLAVDTLTRSGSSASLELQLTPQAGAGSPISPPTYANSGGKSPYLLFGSRDSSEDNERFDHVQLNSIQAESNVMEQAFAEAWRAAPQSLGFPLVEADFSEHAPHLNFSILEAPHNLADARLRDCVDENNTEFRAIPEVKSALDSHSRAMTGLYLLAPVSILTGVWDTHAPQIEAVIRRQSGTQLRVRRALTAEIIGNDVCTRMRKFVLQDPLQIVATLPLSQIDPTYKALLKSEDPEEGASTTKKKNEPAMAGLSAVPDDGTIKSGGVLAASITYRAYVAVPVLRTYNFPVDGKSSPEVDHAARRVLVALAILGVSLRMDRGFCLRSNCDLDVASGNSAWRFHGRTRDDADLIFTGKISTEEAYAVYNRACAEAKALGLKWEEGRRLTVRPGAPLVQVLAQNLRARGGEKLDLVAEDGEDDASAKPSRKSRGAGKASGGK